jgi:peptide/nickel transport system substrate-binding protein
MISRRGFAAGSAVLASGVASHRARAAGAATIGIQALPPGLGNPLSSNGFPPLHVFPAVFDALIEVTADGTYAPALALAWEAEDETAWRIDLRPDVQFSNGELCDARAVAATFDILNTPEGRTQAVYRDARTVGRAEVIDDLTVRLHTSTPDAALPGKLCGIRILPPEHFAARGFAAFAREPVGTGPFRATRWDQRRIDLVPNPNAWRPPQVDSLSLIPIPEEVARLQALLSGGVDVALSINPEDGPLVESAGGRTITTSRAAVLALQYILERPSPLQDARVRQALSLAVNRNAIVQVILVGTTEPATQLTVKEAFGYAPGLPPFAYNPERAKELMSDAGYASGFRLPMSMFSGSSPNDTAVYQQVAVDLARIGVELVITTIPLAQFTRLLYDGDWGDALAFSFHYGSMPSLDSTIGLRFNSCLWPEPWICDPAVADQILESDRTFDPAARRALLQDIQRKLHADLPCLPLHETRFQNGLGPRVAQFSAPFGLIDYAALRMVA